MAVSLVIFLAVSLSIWAAVHLLADFFPGERNRIRKRLADEFTSSPSGPTSSLFKNLDQLDLESVPAEGLVPGSGDRPAPNRGWRGWLEEMLQQANLKITGSQVEILAAAAGLALGIALTFLGGPLLGIGGALAGASAPFLYVHYRRKSRREKFLKQLPNAFDLMARVIRAGHSVSQALQTVVEAFEDPIASEFANCEKQLNLGLRPEVTYQEMARRSGILELRIFVMAMLIQRQSGGNLSDILERLAVLVRSRIKLRNQIRTLTAEGRLQGLTLVCLPFVVFAALMMVNRQYAEALLEHRKLLVAAGCSLLVGVLWIRKIVNLDA